MNKKFRFNPISGMSRMAGLALGLVVSGQVIGAEILIDGMTVIQGTSSNPAIEDCDNAPPNVWTHALNPTSTAIYGQNRVIMLTRCTGSEPLCPSAISSTGQCTRSYVNGGGITSWAVANDPGTPTGGVGWGAIVWSGASTLNAYNLPPINGNKVNNFLIERLSSDQITTFYIQIATSDTQCSQAVIATNDTGSATWFAPNVQIPMNKFTAGCTGYPGAGAVDVANIREVRIFFNPAVNDIDTTLRGVRVITRDENGGNGVPAVNEWGMLLLTILLGAMGYVVARRREA